jgi:hypothetical protein
MSSALPNDEKAAISYLAGATEVVVVEGDELARAVPQLMTRGAWEGPLNDSDYD